MRIGIIGNGAIGRYVRNRALENGHVIRVFLLRPERLRNRAKELHGTSCVSAVADLPNDVDHMVDCAGHEALKSYGPDILRSGTDLTTVSLGALAGIGFDNTQVKLIADPNISENVHEVEATGDFGSFSFQIRGHSLPDNPRSSALAAMSVVSKLEQESQSILF